MGRPKHIRVMAGALEGDMFVGQRADDHRGLLSIKYPMEHGIITDWNDMERIWTHIYGKVIIIMHTEYRVKSNVFIEIRTNCLHFLKNIQFY